MTSKNDFAVHPDATRPLSSVADDTAALPIDPEPLAGDPGFDLLPALHNRWDEVVATSDVARAVLRRFDLLTEVLDLDRQRATGWTLSRVLQNVLWDIEDGETALDPAQIAIATALLHRQALTKRPV